MPTTYAIPDGRVAMAATLYTGTGAAQTISNVVNGVSMQPDFVWLKARSSAYNNSLFDSVRGVGNELNSNLTAAEAFDATTLTAFNSNGFSVGSKTGINGSGTTFVGWQWKAGGTAVSNTAGSITSQVSANPTAGFSVVTYTGTGVAATIGHGLGVAPSMIIVKARSGTGDWIVYTSITGAGNYLLLNSTAASAAGSTKWNNTAPTSSVFSVGIDTTTNLVTTTYVAYCFAPIAGYSAIGSYSGNGNADGTFVYTGFRPRWVMTGPSSNITNWAIIDTSRDTYNLAGQSLEANLSNAEYTPASSGYPIDILSNGFKQRSASQPNTSGQSYIYMAFAENPLKYANAR